MAFLHPRVPGEWGMRGAQRGRSKSFFFILSKLTHVGKFQLKASPEDSWAFPWEISNSEGLRLGPPLEESHPGVFPAPINLLCSSQARETRPVLRRTNPNLYIERHWGTNWSPKCHQLKPLNTPPGREGHTGAPKKVDGTKWPHTVPGLIVYHWVSVSKAGNNSTQGVIAGTPCVRKRLGQLRPWRPHSPKWGCLVWEKWHV